MKNLANTLSQMFSLSITNLETLREYPAIYENFFLQLDTFITTIVFCSKKNRKQLLELTQNFGIDTDDIRFDCLERCVTKLSLVLAQDLDHQIPYLYTICNNMIINWYRAAIKECTTIVSLNKTIENHNEKMIPKQPKLWKILRWTPKLTPNLISSQKHRFWNSYIRTQTMPTLYYVLLQSTC